MLSCRTIAGGPLARAPGAARTRARSTAIASPLSSPFPASALAVPVALALAVLASACGPHRHHGLEAVQREYQAARADPAIVSHASAELGDAGLALARAENAFEEGEESETRHYVRLADTELEKARQLAGARSAKAQSEVVEKQITRIEDELAALRARETERGILLTLSDVFFEVDSARLKPEGMQNLAQLAAFLNAHPDRALAIEGHADATGTDAYNQRLSERRAEAVRSFLIASGVGPTRIATQGFGERYPVASNDTTTGRAMNRRVEMLVMNPGETVRVSSVPIVRYHETTTTTRTTLH